MSWVIRNKVTGEVLFETFDKHKVDALNTIKYEAVPIWDYLGSINGTEVPYHCECGESGCVYCSRATT